MRWIKVCHPCNLNVQDYHRYKQLISRLPYTQSPWRPVISSKGISPQLKTQLGREKLYTLFSFSPFSFEIENTLESLWSDIIDLHNIFFFLALQCECAFFKYQAFDLSCSTRTLYKEWKPFLYKALLCWEEEYFSLEEVQNIPSENPFQALLSLNTLLRGVKGHQLLEQNPNYALLP